MKKLYEENIGLKKITVPEGFGRADPSLPLSESGIDHFEEIGLLEPTLTQGPSSESTKTDT